MAFALMITLSFEVPGASFVSPNEYAPTKVSSGEDGISGQTGSEKAGARLAPETMMDIRTERISRLMMTKSV